MAMGPERTAGDRLDAIMGRLEKYLLNPSAASAFRNPTGTYKRGAARVITEGLTNGLTPPEFKAKVEGSLRFKEGWKTAPDVVFEVAEAAAKGWRTVEEFQRSGAARGKYGSGASAGGATARKSASFSPSKRRSGGALTCWTCGGAGHRSADCQSSEKSGSGKGSGPRGAGQQPAHSPGRQHTAAAPVRPRKAVLDSGAGISTISAAVARRLQATHPDSTIVEALGHPRELRLADGSRRFVEHKTLPLTPYKGLIATRFLTKLWSAWWPADMVMSPAEEAQGRKEALAAAVESAASAGLSGQGRGRLESIIDRHWDAFRSALRGDRPARVEPMRTTLVPGARAVKARLRTYNPTKTAWWTLCLTTLVAMGMLFLNPQAVWASAAMVLEKSGGKHRLVSDFRAINKTVEKSPAPMPNQEAEMQRMGQATCYGSLDMLQGYWQMPLAP
eukprot:g2537.t1